MTRSYIRPQVGGQGRIPVTHEGIQVNFCRNLQCRNFGILPLSRVDKGRNPSVSDDYQVNGAKGKNKRGTSISIFCKKCGQAFSLKSNLAVSEEFRRQQTPFFSLELDGCTHQGCCNFGKPVSEYASLYQSFGTTPAGSLRYRCKACKKTLSVRRSSTWRQRKPEINEVVLRLLVNKVPMRRICEVAAIEPAVLYNRIDHIYRQTTRFAVTLEKQLQERQFERLRIAVDRQEHAFNWTSSADRRITHLMAVGSADCDSGYVLALELDYDPTLNAFEVDLHAREIGDYDLAQPFRRYARLFLPEDRKSQDLSSDEPATPNIKLPSMGVRLHSEYVMMGHFRFLRWLLPNASEIHFYLDQEPGIRAACMTAFSDLIAQRRLEAFFVRIAKTMTVDDKKLEIARNVTALNKLQEQYPALSRRRIAIEVTKQRFLQMQQDQPNPMNRWVECILSNMGEPRKAVLYATDRGDADAQVLASDMLLASLHPIDRFFMQMRRRISLLERPISTPSAGQHRWYGYSSYNPDIAQKIMSSFRVVYNYCLAGADGKTPAMKLGLASRVYTYQDLMDFV